MINCQIHTSFTCWYKRMVQRIGGRGGGVVARGHIKQVYEILAKPYPFHSCKETIKKTYILNMQTNLQTLLIRHSTILIEIVLNFYALWEIYCTKVHYRVCMHGCWSVYVYKLDRLFPTSRPLKLTLGNFGGIIYTTG